MDESLYAYPQVDRPWVRASMVASVDGSGQDGDGVSGSLGGEPDHEVFALLRRLADVVLVSAGTARAEGYGPIDDGPLVVVSRSLDLPERLRTHGVVVLTTETADADLLAALRQDGVEVLQHGQDDIDWPSAVKTFAPRGWHRVLCEGGPSLLGTLTEEDLLDELCLTIAPTLLGGDGSRIITSEHTAAHPMRLEHAVDVEGVLLTRWTRSLDPDRA